MASESPLVWFITGTSTGLGRELTLAALARGDKVIATARGCSLDKLDDLKEKGAHVMKLDVTAPSEEFEKVAKEAVEVYGRVDVLVNNAGYVLSGAMETSTSQETLNQFQANVFGPLNISRAFMPYMREKKRGTILWCGSGGGWMSLPYMGLYGATKWAVRGIAETLNDEISMFGLRSICVDFGALRTDLLKAHKEGVPKAVARLPEYQGLTDMAEGVLRGYAGNQPGDPRKAAEVVVDLAHATGVFSGKTVPRSLNLGSDSFHIAEKHCKDNLDRLEAWKEVASASDYASEKARAPEDVYM